MINPIPSELKLIPPRNVACLPRFFKLGILIVKELSARRLYKPFGVKGLMHFAMAHRIFFG
jgi:hypothetical protein